MAKSFRRPKDKTELDDREVRGLWRAIRLTSKLGKSSKRLSLGDLYALHRTIFEESQPHIAGLVRRAGQDVKKLACIEPPLGSAVQNLVYAFWTEFDQRLALLPRHPKNQSRHQRERWYADVIDIAAWTQHKIAAIHPFCDGNGRVARLVTNLVLRRFGLPETPVHYEGQNKESYLNALCQIDEQHDYEPLKHLIAQGIHEALEREAKIRRRKVSGH